MTRFDDRERRLTDVVDRYSRRADTNEVSFALSRPGEGWAWQWREAEARAPIFLASATKLMTTSIVLQLAHERRLRLDDPAARHLGSSMLARLNLAGGVDHGDQITIEQLLAHTSGIPDYFERKRPGGSTLMGELMQHDRGWDCDEALAMAREMHARFPPGADAKAEYSDTNYQLLGRLIEELDGRPFAEALAVRVAEPLGLVDTYLFDQSTIGRFDEVAAFLHGTEPFRIPRAMASFGADGGAVSTALEARRFVEAFFGGELFPAVDLDRLTATWRRIFAPLRYGIGVMRYAAPKPLAPIMRFPPMIGHSGASGVVVFRAERGDLHLAGTVNQEQKRSLVYRLMSELAVIASR